MSKTREVPDLGIYELENKRSHAQLLQRAFAQFFRQFRGRRDDRVDVAARSLKIEHAHVMWALLQISISANGRRIGCAMFAVLAVTGARRSLLSPFVKEGISSDLHRSTTTQNFVASAFHLQTSRALFFCFIKIIL